MGVNSSYSFIFSSLWHFIKKYSRYDKMWQLFFYKMRRKFTKNAKSARFLTTRLITKWDSYYIWNHVFCEPIFSGYKMKALTRNGSMTLTDWLLGELKSDILLLTDSALINFGDGSPKFINAISTTSHKSAMTFENYLGAIWESLLTISESQKDNCQQLVIVIWKFWK